MKTTQDDSSTSHVHVSPLPMFFAIFAALMVGTFLTVWAAFQDFGPMDTPVALLIAIIKATLVIMFFMHVKYSSKVVMMSAASGFLFLIFLFAFTFADIGTRKAVAGWGTSIDKRTPVEAGLTAPTTEEKVSLDDMPLVAQGEYHFNNTYACASCHSLQGERKVGPALNGRWGGIAPIEGGNPVAFDDGYFRESVYNSRAKIAQGYPPAMPVFQGIMKDQHFEAITAYVKTYQ